MPAAIIGVDFSSRASGFPVSSAVPTVPLMNDRLSDIAAVSFDFYNTLVYHRTGRGRAAMLMEYLGAHGLESGPWEHQVLYDVFAPHATEYSPELPDEEKRRYRRRLAERVFRRLNVKVPEGAAARHAANLWELLGPACLAVYREVPAVLEKLKRAGLPLVIVSNWQCGLAHFCAELGLAPFFDHIIASAEVGSAKPDAGIFGEACQRLGLPPSRVLHVGDSPVDDVEGARGAGLAAVLLQREDESPDLGVPVLGSLEGVPALLGLDGVIGRPTATDDGE
jgi:HAD superfamily hydrolase (TIGR01549 family)